MAPAAVGTILAALLALRPAAEAGRDVQVLAALGAAGVLLVAASWRWRALLLPGLAALVAQYGAFVALRGGTLDRWAPLEAAGLVAMAELAAWGSQHRATVPLSGDRALPALRGAAVGAAALGALAVGAIVLVAAGAGPAGGAAWEVVGALAILSAAAVVTVGLRRLA